MKIDETPPDSNETEKLTNGITKTTNGSTELSSELSEEDINLALSDDDGNKDDCDNHLLDEFLQDKSFDDLPEMNEEASNSASNNDGSDSDKTSLNENSDNFIKSNVPSIEGENNYLDKKQEISENREDKLNEVDKIDLKKAIRDSNNLLVEDDRKFEELPNGSSSTPSSDEAEDQSICQSPISEVDGKSSRIAALVIENSAEALPGNILEDPDTTMSMDLDFSTLPETTEKLASAQLDIDLEDSVDNIETTMTDLSKDDILTRAKIVDEMSDTRDKLPSQKRSADQETDVNKNLEPQSKKLKPSQNVQLSARQLTRLSNLKNLLETKILKSLNREELEQLVMQKICEAIVDKSELGDLRQTVQVLEQKVESWRNNSVQLAKQLRDLEIVTRRCAVDLKGRKDVIPIRNTRSVGLQVNTTIPLRPRVDNVANQEAIKRRQNSRILPSPSISGNSPSKTVNGIPNGIVSPPKQIKTIPPKTPQANNPILSKALSTKEKSPSMPNTPTPGAKFVNIPVSHIPGPQSANKVIDLTDEDESKTTPTPTTIATTAIITNPGTGLGGTGTRYMYVVPNNPLQQGILTSSGDPSRLGQPTKAVVLKLNSSPLAQSNGRHPSYIVRSGTAPNGTVSLVPHLNNAIRQAPPLRMSQTKSMVKDMNAHPAPLPTPPKGQQLSQSTWKHIPPRPILTIRRGNDGIILSWKMPPNLTDFEEIASYQLYAYQETNVKPSTDMWRKVGDVKALALPMACTLSQFADGNKYYFAVRAVDIKKRVGNFSAPEAILS